MKQLFQLVVFAVMGGHLMPPPALAQGVDLPTKLSKMEKQDFEKWMVGTEWQIPMGNDVYRAWFASPSLVVLVERDGARRVEPYYPYRGEVGWDGKLGSLEESFNMKVDENLTGAKVEVGELKISSNLLGRRQLPAIPEMTVEAFYEWLKAHTLNGEDGHTVTLNSQGLISYKSPKIAGEIQVQPSVLAAGVFQFSWESASQNCLYIISPDLNSFQAYTSSGGVKGAVINTMPKTDTPTSTVAGEVAVSDAAVIPLKKNMASLNSLMVMDLGNSRYAGKASKLSISALKVQSMAPATVKFNQIVGPDMSKALEEVVRFHSLRHNGWPQAYRIELAFADKYTTKDGPSAAVACALALESLISGTELEPAFAVTGDLNADGAVQPIGGVSAKLRGATNSGMRLVAIPEKNRLSTVDLAITEGITPFLHTQIFSIATFDEALALARADKSPALEQSLAQYSLLCEQLRSNPQALRIPANIEILAAISARTPNHVAARLLLAKAQNKLPTRLSAGGSLEAIDQCVAAIAEGIDSDLGAGSNLDAGKLADASFKLIRLRQAMDLNVLPYADAWINWSRLADLIVSGRGATTQNLALFRVARQKLGAEQTKLRGNAAFNEALMK